MNKRIIIISLLGLVLLPGGLVVAAKNNNAPSAADDCIPVTSALTPIQWEYADLASNKAWEKRFPPGKKITSEQSGHADPIPLSRQSLKNLNPYKQALDQLIGPIPDNCSPLHLTISPTDVRLTAEQMSTGHIIPLIATSTTDGTTSAIGYRMLPHNLDGQAAAGDSARLFYLTYQDAVQQRIAGYLLVPEDRSGQLRTGPLPGVIALHQTLTTCGKREQIDSCPDGGLPWTAFGQEFARRGFVVLTFDAPNFGESFDENTPNTLEYNSPTIQGILKKYPRASEVGAELMYIQRSITALTTQSVVTIGKLGIIGHSKGGTMSLLAKVYFPKIVAAISNAPGLHLFRYDDLPIFPNGLKGSVARWGGWGYLPEMGRYRGRLKDLPLDVQHIYALAVKNGALFTVQVQDDGFPPKASNYWKSIDFLNRETTRVAPILKGEYRYGVVKSGYFDPDGKKCYDAAGKNLAKLSKCITTFGYQHGVYPKVITPLIDQMEHILKSGKLSS